jgi:2'-5' RNA ligase
VASHTPLLQVVVLFEGALGQRLAHWRRSYDPLGADRIPPHLTLVSPFPAQPSLLPIERRLWAVCHSSPPVWLELGDVARDDGLLYVEVVSGGPELARLRNALYTGPLPPKADSPLAKAKAGRAFSGQATGAFRPRIVVAEPASEQDLAQASQQLLGLPVRASYEVKRLHLMAAHADRSWYVRDFFGLDGAYAASPAIEGPGRTE